MEDWTVQELYSERSGRRSRSDTGFGATMDKSLSCSKVSLFVGVQLLLLRTFIRDIPLPLVTSGCENSGNLRELALNRMKDFGAECRDVRFREVGVRTLSTAPDRPKTYLPIRYIDSRDPPQSSPRVG